MSQLSAHRQTIKGKKKVRIDTSNFLFHDQKFEFLGLKLIRKERMYFFQKFKQNMINII